MEVQTANKTRQAAVPKEGRVYLCHPSYGSGNPISHKQFWVGPTTPDSPWRGRLNLHQTGGSLLCTVFNAFWCDALNQQEAGVDYRWFVMLHDDVIPDDGWLDVLLNDLLAWDADVMGCVVPIKDMLGLSSTAVDDPADPYAVERRLTMHEVCRLPQVFSAADCGYPQRRLLVNTGLWACRFDRPWRHAVDDAGQLRVCFNIADQVRRGPDRRWQARVAPEDWNFSRAVQAQGGKVLATRNVRLVHMGALPYTNQQAWGEWEHDHALGHKFGHRPILFEQSPNGPALPAQAEPPAAWVGTDRPYWSGALNDVDGWMNDTEGAALQRFAAGKVVVEIGSYCGRSTIWLARQAKLVHAVDTFDGRATPRPRDTMEEFQQNMVRHGVADRVRAHRGTSREVLPSLAGADLAFIDGAHDEASVRQDIRLALAALKPGGLIAFHDWQRPCDPGVTAAIQAFLDDGAQLLEVVESVALVRPPWNQRTPVTPSQSAKKLTA